RRRDDRRRPGDLAGQLVGTVADDRGRSVRGPCRRRRARPVESARAVRFDRTTRPSAAGAHRMPTAAQPRLAEIGLPVFEEPAVRPELPSGRYAERLAALRARMAANAASGRPGWDRLVVYADREHSASMSFLTGFDPRFEEALLIVGPDGDP